MPIFGEIGIDSGIGLLVSYLIALSVIYIVSDERGHNLKRELRGGKIRFFGVLGGIIIAISFSIITYFAAEFDLPARLFYFYGESSPVSDNSLISFSVVMLAAPVVEEIVFRGIVLGELKTSMNFYFANFLSALAFGIMHGSVFQAACTFVFGFILGLTAKKSRGLFLPVIIHIVYNLCDFLSDYYYILAEFSGGYIILISAIILILGYFVIPKKS